MANQGAQSLVTLQTLISQAIALSDQTNSNFISTAEWIAYANFHAGELYRRIAQADPSRYIQRNPDYDFPLQTGFIQYSGATGSFGLDVVTGGSSGTRGTITNHPDQDVGNSSGTLYMNGTTGGTFTLGETITDTNGATATVTNTYQSGNQYNPLPANFWRCNRVDYIQSLSNPLFFLTLLGVNMLEEDVYQYPYCNFYGQGLRFMLSNTQINFIPSPNVSGMIRLIYTPYFTQLVNLSDTLDDVSGFADSISMGMAILALQKEGTDASILMRMKDMRDKEINRIEQQTREQSTPVQTVRMRYRQGYSNNGPGFGRW